MSTATAARACTACGCVLARDNTADRCAPCERSRIVESARRRAAPATELSPASIERAWTGDLPRFAERLETGLVAAAEIAWDAGLIPSRWRLDRAALLTIAGTTDASHVDLARSLDVSRWAVARWRERLGLTRRDDAPTEGTGPASAEPETGPAPVMGVTVSALGPVTVTGPSGSEILTAVAERIVRVLAAGHPLPVHPEALAATIYPDDPPERARRSLHSAVWRLRRRVPDGVLESTERGYVLGVGEDAVDVARFCRSVDAARVTLDDGRTDDAVSFLELGLGLWPAGGLDWTGLDDLAGALTERWVEALDLAARVVAEIRDSGREPDPGLSQILARVAGPSTEQGPAALPPWLRTMAGHGSFVGRFDAAQAITHAVHEAAERGTTLVLVAGEPGIGKTRLVAECAAELAREGTQVWGGRCDPHQVVPFGSMLATLRLLTQDRAGGGTLGAGRLHGLVSGHPFGDGAEPDGAGAQYALFDEIADVLRSATGQGPALLIVDDLQWAPDATLLLLRHLLTDAADLPLAIVGTVRDNAAPQRSTAGLLSTLGRLPNARSIALTGLAVDDVAALPGVAGDERERAAAAARLHALTDGNPLFLDVVLAAGEETGAVTGPSLLAAVDAHLDALDERSRFVLTVAAVSGTEVNPAIVRRALRHLGDENPDGAGDRRPGTDDVGDALDAAERSGILLADETGSYGFRHEVLRAALVEHLATARRGGIHRAIADALADGPGADHGPRLHRLAWHVREAGAEIDPARAYDVALRAARSAAGNLDFGAAARGFDDAAAAAARLGNGDRSALLLESAASWRCSGDVDVERARLETAVSASLAERSWVAHARAVVALGRHELHRTGRLASETRAMVESARRALAGADQRLAGELRYLAVVEEHPGLTPGRAGLATALGIEHDRGADPSVITEIFWNAGPADRPALADAAHRHAASDGSPHDRAWALLFGWLADIERGRAGIDDPVAAEIDALVDQASDPALTWARDAWSAGRDLAAGRLVVAERSIDEAYRRARAAALPVDRLAEIQAAHRGQRYMFDLLVLQPHDRLVVSSVGRRSAPDPLAWDRTFVAGLVAAGRIEEARRLFERSCDAAVDPTVHTPAPLFALALSAHVSEPFDDIGRSKSLLEALDPWRGHQLLLRNMQSFGAVDRVLAYLERTIGDVDAALTSLEAARAQDERQGIAVWSTVAGIELAETLAGHGDRPGAQRLLPTLREETRSLGMTRAARRIETFVAEHDLA